MLVVGLTGGVASGKTTVSQILQQEGSYLIDADQIARELVQPRTPTWGELIRVFGKEILQKDESINRKKLAATVFSNPQKRRLLEEILHPQITKEIDRRVEAIRKKDPEAVVVVDAALLVETGTYRRMDKLIVVTATETQQIERLGKRTGAARKEAKGIISSQRALEEKVKVADFIIRNEGTLEETSMRAKEIFQELKTIARHKGKHATAGATC
ncbi:MAG: dephospho-CoA kinase [Deltaproteobacteria bacterium RBG_13_47_9]|nr:MAG: dephospho-CoA kinase [Deltaproteobacteria bacterium RBG_13_47_9]